MHKQSTMSGNFVVKFSTVVIILVIVTSGLVYFQNVEVYMVQFTHMFYASCYQFFCDQDEIFHIPQAQQYCQNNFNHWDNKITTFPGIYYTSYWFVQTCAYLMGADPVYLCGTTMLRSVNIISACFLPFIYIKCRSKVGRIHIHSLSIRDLFSLRFIPSLVMAGLSL
jgi:alpha-1,2-glucosyltransferase